MKKIISVLLAALMLISLFSGCGKKEKEKTMAELLVGDWYTFDGVPYRSFSADGTVTGSDYYSSAYTAEGDSLVLDSAGEGRKVTLNYYTDGEILRLSADIGSYFTTRRYYCRNADEPKKWTGLPEKGTTDENIFGLWYNGDTLFFGLGSDCSVSHYPTADSFCFDGESLVLLRSGAASDEAARCSLSGDTLTIFYTDELTGSEASLVLTKGA